MPIDENNGIGFNPFEEYAMPVSRTVSGSGSTAINIDNIWSTTSISAIQAQKQFEVLVDRQRLHEDRIIKKPKLTQSKQKPISKLLDELSSKNCEVFDDINKIQVEINTIEEVRITELANKYDNLLFLVIGKNYTLTKAGEKNKIQYINTLKQSLVNTLSRYVYNIEIYGEQNESTFNENLLHLLMGRVMITNELMPKITEMSKDLYNFMNDITTAKKKKREIMGREDKKPTVCEDYIYGNSTDSIRISLNY